MYKEAYWIGHYAASHLPVIQDPETRHNLALTVAHNLIEPNPAALKILEDYFTEGRGRPKDKRLKTPLANGALVLDTPFMVAPGLDKDGQMVLALHTLGASAIEIGSVLLRAQPGNPRPRLHEPTPETLINAMGFNSAGLIAVKKNLQRYKNLGIPIGTNIGLNKIVLQDKESFPEAIYPDLLAWVAEILYDESSYLVINVSSPNTPGLRDLQEENFLSRAVERVYAVMDKKGEHKPLYIKLSPDLDCTGTEKVVGVILKYKLAGAICSNTTVNREVKAGLGSRWIDVKGGVSGAHPGYRKLVLDQISMVYRLTNGSIDIIACGGIDSLPAVLRAAGAGANAFQILTPATRCRPGPFVYSELASDTLAWTEKEGKTLTEIRGIDAKVLA